MAAPAVVSLHFNKLSRVGDVFMTILITAFSLCAFIFFGAIVGAATDKIAAFFIWGIGAVLCVLAFISGLKRARKKAPHLILEEDRLVIKHDEVFDPPAEIPKANIAHVAVEYSSRRLKPSPVAFKEVTAFPLAEIDGTVFPGQSGYLYSSEEPNPIPLVCSGDDVPNLAVLFHQPHIFATTRRFKAATMYSDRFRMHFLFPNRTDEVLGFMTRVRDPRSAEQAFGQWGMGTGPIPEDVGRRALPDAQTAAYRNTRRALIIGLLIAGAIAIRSLGEAVTN